MAAAALLAGAALLTTAAAATADTPSPSASPAKGSKSDKGAPTEAGTSFLTATPFRPGQQATAGASTGDYLYWVVPVDTGQRLTVKADVTLPAAAQRHGPATWRIDVYDGLRRRQPCAYGTQAVAAAKEAGTVQLACTLRSVRSGAEAWSNDPLPGSYYIRLTVTDLPAEDLGLPVRAKAEASTKDLGGALAVDGALSTPLVPGVTKAQQSGTSAKSGENLREPDGGWSGGRWSDRWLWTAAGGVLAALGGILGHSLTRGSGRPSRVPPRP
jgi:hypothetical protein